MLDETRAKLTEILGMFAPNEQVVNIAITQIDSIYQKEMQEMSRQHLLWWSNKLLDLYCDPEFKLPKSTSTVHILHEFDEWLTGLVPEDMPVPKR